MSNIILCIFFFGVLMAIIAIGMSLYDHHESKRARELADLERRMDAKYRSPRGLTRDELEREINGVPHRKNARCRSDNAKWN